jgi:hypothetical protein
MRKQQVISLGLAPDRRLEKLGANEYCKNDA